MAFALPSFNAAVASANTSGLPMQRLMSQIDFNDVKSTAATAFMAKDALQSKVLQANIAKQALAEYGGTLRNQMTLDYNREVLDAEKEVRENAKKDARRAKLFEMFGGGLNELVSDPLGQKGTQSDERQEFITELDFRALQNQHLKNTLGGLHPDAGTTAAILQSGNYAPPAQVPGARANQQIQGIYQVQPSAVPKLEQAQPVSWQGLVDQLNAISGVGRTTQKK